MSRGGTHKEKVNLNAGAVGEGGDHDLLLRGRCPGNGATATPPPNYDYKEGAQTNQCCFFSLFKQ